MKSLMVMDSSKSWWQQTSKQEGEATNISWVTGQVNLAVLVTKLSMGQTSAIIFRVTEKQQANIVLFISSP